MTKILLASAQLLASRLEKWPGFQAVKGLAVGMKTADSKS